jgi:hypothetical protein
VHPKVNPYSAMTRKKAKRKQVELDLGSKELRCAHCGHQFEVAWRDIFDLQEITHGPVGYEFDDFEHPCPRCGEGTSDEEVTWLEENRSQVKLPKRIKADMERAFIHAYYRYVCQCSTVSIDWEVGGDPWVAVARNKDRIWFMDFSTLYDFPAEQKQTTMNRRMLERVQAAQREVRYAEPPREAVYEVWCFIPPSERLLTALEWTRQNGGQLTLVTPERVQERVRQTVLAIQNDSEEHAFVQAALMIRQAFNL